MAGASPPPVIASTGLLLAAKSLNYFAESVPGSEELGLGLPEDPLVPEPDGLLEGVPLVPEVPVPLPGAPVPVPMLPDVPELSLLPGLVPLESELLPLLDELVFCMPLEYVDESLDP